MSIWGNPVMMGGSGGGGGGDTTMALAGIAGVISTRQQDPVNPLTFTVENQSGLYAAILCWMRGAITVPSDATLLYSARRQINEYETDVYLVKKKITSNNEIISIGNNSVTRSGGVCFVVTKDFTATELSKINNLSNTVTWGAGISVFTCINGTTTTMHGMISANTYPVSYIFPTDVGNTSGNMISRMLAGFINADKSGTAAIGANSSDSSAGFFVCLQLVPTA